MALNRRCPELVFVVLAGCGLLPPDRPPAPPAPPDPDAPVLHAWKVTGHVVGPRGLISELDAAEFHGRTVAVSAAGYDSPWSGSCGDAARQRATRTLADITGELGVAPTSLALADPIVEYRLSCGIGGTGRAPPLTVFVDGARAVTCWSGVCYLLARP